MERLINTSNYPLDLDRFGATSKEVEKFLKKLNLTGVELIQCGELDEKRLNGEIIKGVHLRYYPIWLDFYKGNIKELEKQFGTMDTVKQFYGGTIEDIIETYRNELKLAKSVGAKYVVFHVTHVALEHCFTYKFPYSNEEIINASIEFLNEVLKGFEGDFYLLFENLWWPGLNFLDKKLAEKLLSKVNYSKCGFMLDTAHLINTNINLNTEEEGIDYVKKKIMELGTLKNYIKGIHLNCSISGPYVRKKLKEKITYKNPHSSEEFFENFKLAYDHIFNIDQHKPFTHTKVSQIVELVSPEFLVYEFAANTKEILKEYILTQHKALGISNL